MVIVDLITGFLGAGKTTFIHKYLHYLKKQGLRVRMIENEFGDVNVDSRLLSADDCEIEDLTGLCMCCVGRDAFIRMLKEAAESGCDRILVEPSGIYDVDEFFEVLSLPEIARVCEIGCILTIADPAGMDGLTEEAEYLLFAQLLASGTVLISKTQFLSDAEIENTLGQLNRLMQDRGCEAGLLAEICIKPWEELTEADFSDICDSGYMRVVHDREQFIHSDVFQSAAIFGHCYDQRDLERRVEQIFLSPACGRVYRIKGFVRAADGDFYEVNSTWGTMSVRRSVEQEEVLVVIGQQLNRSEIRSIFRLE